MRRRNLIALLALAACATPGPPIEAGWLIGRWQTSDVSAVTGGRWTLVVERAGADGSVVGVWRSGTQPPEATSIRFEGDRLYVLTPQGERARFRRTPEGTLDGVVRPAGSNANSVPVTLVRS
jgi:hypothetical protein